MTLTDLKPWIDSPAPPSPSTALLRGIDHLTTTSQRDFVRCGFGESRPVPARRVEEAFTAVAREHADIIAVRDAEGAALTYAELDAASDRLAAWLIAHGVAPGDHVGVFLSRGLEWVVAIVATLKAGAAWVPQDARQATPTMLAHIVDVADISVVLTSASCAPGLPPLDAQVQEVDLASLRWGSGDGPGEALPSLGRGEGEVAVVIFTSGTTGTPNGVQVTHANLLNTLLIGPASLGIQPGMNVAQLLHIAFDMSVWEVFGALLHGGSLLIRGRDISRTAARAHVIIATPSVLAAIDPLACRRAQIVAVAGERCPEALAAAWRDRVRFHNSCGPTEVTIVNTVHELSSSDELTIGSPIPNTTVYVLDDDLRPVETGEVGEMWAGGACVTRGYLGNPELTRERYRPDPFIGGVMFRCRDLVSWTPDGQLVHHGRTDDLVKVRGGFRVELDAVTQAIESCGRVETATTLLWKGALVSVVTLAGASGSRRSLLCDADDPRVAPVVRAVTDALPYYYQPEHVVLVDAVPLTSRGKVDKRAIESMLTELEGRAAA